MLGIARWTDKGGSYRSIQRFFGTVITWPHLSWVFFQHFLFKEAQTYLLACDETIVSKAGSTTYGLDRFFQVCKGKSSPV